MNFECSLLHGKGLRAVRSFRKDLQQTRILLTEVQSEFW